MTVAGVTTDSKTETITVHPQTGPLTASAHGVIGYVAGHAGTITLSSQVSGGTAPYTYLWIGTPADNIQWRFTAQPTTANPTGVYLEKSGITYVFTLTITDSSDPVQTATATVTEALNNPPKISIQASVKDFDVRFAASLTDGSGVIDPTSYAWDFGDGSTSSEASPSHFYALALTYTVNLSVLDTLGAPAAASKQITIVGGGGGGECLGALSADFMADASSRDGIVNFHAVVTGGTCQYSKYTWTFGDGNVSSVSDPSNVYSASGTYHVTLQVTDSDGNSATGDRDIEVTVLPYCDAHPNVSGCQAPPLPSSNIIAIIVYVVLGVLAAGMLIFGLVMRNWILVILGIALPVILALIIIIGVVPLPMVG
jgi:PKD repeat protein